MYGHFTFQGIRRSYQYRDKVSKYEAAAAGKGMRDDSAKSLYSESSTRKLRPVRPLRTVRRIIEVESLLLIVQGLSLIEMMCSKVCVLAWSEITFQVLVQLNEESRRSQRKENDFRSKLDSSSLSLKGRLTDSLHEQVTDR